VLSSATVFGAGTADAVVTAAGFSYQGSAWGTYANVGSVVTSGPSAVVGLGCTRLAGLHRTNSTAGVSVPPLVSTSTIATTADTFLTPMKSALTASTQGVSLLSGLITASVATAASSTSNSAGVFSVSSAGTSFTNLVVAGVSITALPAPNTRITLPGFGYVVLNEQVSRIGATSALLSINALRVFITTANPLGIAPNTNLLISHADSGLAGPVAGVLGGFAYGSTARVGSLITSGPSFLASMHCLGTGGAVGTNTGLGITIPSLLSTGTITDTVMGTVTAAAATGEATSTVQSANVLSGLVNATGVKADAHATTDSTTFTYTDTGTGFVTLSVAGFPAIDANVAPNTQLAIPGVGTLYLRRTIRSARSIEIRMIELVLTNVVSGLPVGTDLRVAVAAASAE